MKTFLKSLLSALLVLVMSLGLLFALCFFVIKLTLPGLLRDGLADTTGFPVSVTSSSCSLLSLHLEAQGVIISNSNSFPTGNFAEVESVSAKLGKDANGRFIFESLQLHLTKLSLATSATGQLNLTVFGKEAGPLVADALDQVTGLLGDDTFPPVLSGEIKVDSVILPDGQFAAGFPRTVSLQNVTSAQSLLRLLAEIATP